MTLFLSHVSLSRPPRQKAGGGGGGGGRRGPSETEDELVVEVEEEAKREAASTVKLKCLVIPLEGWWGSWESGGGCGICSKVSSRF